MNKKETPIKKWGLMQVWNEIEETGRLETKPRDHIHASDLGGSFLDRWYKMKGVQPSNPYDDRTLRIFSAGSRFHDLVREVFAKAELLNDLEVRVEIPATDTTLAVLGYYDANIGGFKNWAERKKRLKERQVIETKVLEEMSKQYEKQSLKPLIYDFSKYLNWMSDKIIDGLEKLHPDGLLEPIICEIKSINSNAFWARKNFIAEGYPHHRLQLYFYLKATNTKSGALLYISKDDLTLEECPLIYPNDQLEEEFEKDIKEISAYYLFDKKPEPEPNVIFDKKKGKNGLWTINWQMERSPYLTLITGKTKEQWLKDVKVEVKKLNLKKK